MKRLHFFAKTQDSSWYALGCLVRIKSQRCSDGVDRPPQPMKGSKMVRSTSAVPLMKDGLWLDWWFCHSSGSDTGMQCNMLYCGMFHMFWNYPCFSRSFTMFQLFIIWQLKLLTNFNPVLVYITYKNKE